jgi:hypothetical protein
MALYDIASLWIGPELTWMEQLCLQSFLDHGHKVVLFAYDDIKSVPAGVDIRDAREIMADDEIIYHEKTGSPAFHSDIFRLRMLLQTDFLWVDTDAYCLTPFERPDHGYFFGWGSDAQRKLYSGVLGLPKGSKTLAGLLDLTKDHYPIPPWLPRKQRKALVSQKAEGQGVHVSLMKWGVCGPDALNYFAAQTGEASYAFDDHVLYPVNFNNTRAFHRPKLKPQVLAAIKDDTLSVHFYGRRFRNIFAQTQGIPPDGSYMDMLCQRHGIDPNPTAHLFVRRKKNPVAPAQ